MKKYILFIVILSFNSMFSQENLDIDKAIEMALTNSDLYKKVTTELTYSQSNSILFKKTFLPSIFTSSVFPSITKSVTRVTTPDGQDIFVNQNQAYYDLSLNIEQKEPLFGGTFVLSSFLNRIDLFGDINNKVYYSTPFSISYSNSNFFLNSYKYEKVINRLRIEEDNITYNMGLEDIVYQTVEKYFNSYIINKNIEDNLQALKNQKDIYNIAKKRFKIGSINKGDLLSLELNILNTESSINDLISEQKISQRILSNFIKNDLDSIQLALPTKNILELNILFNFAMEKMLENNKLLIELERKKNEKELEIQNEKSEEKLSVGFNTYFGLSNTAESFSESTNNLQNQQSYSVSLRYLLFDFGKNRQKIKLLDIEKEFLDNDYKIEIENLKKELFTLVNKFNSNQKKMLVLNKKTIISKERYDFLKNRFSFGKVTITDLNIAQRESRQIDIDYLKTLRDIWVAYYDIRKLTMYDFNNDVKIKYN